MEHSAVTNVEVKTSSRNSFLQKVRLVLFSIKMTHFSHPGRTRRTGFSEHSYKPQVLVHHCIFREPKQITIARKRAQQRSK